ncbi:MAG: methyltransferase domain-containing protein [Rikenellaceae bacterium]
MGKVIKSTLNHIPREALQRVAGWIVPVVGLLYLGRGKECPICGAKRRRFLPYGYGDVRQNALCPSCLSLERHRLLWLYFTRHTTLFTQRPTMLHIAPEVLFMRRFKRLYSDKKEQYITADLSSPLATMHFDVQDIPLPDDSVEMVMCNHVMEHVESDTKALSELYRILRPGGWGILLAPIDYDRESTFEDDSITDPAERARIFGQYDHRRIYGRDYAERLRQVGFSVTEFDMYGELTEAERKLYSLQSEIIYRVDKL